MTATVSIRTALAFLLVAVVAASVDAQPFAYVVGQRAGPGNTPAIQTISVINTSTNAIVARIPAGLNCLCVAPDSIAITPDGTRVYVPQFNRYVSVIDTATNTMTGTIDVGATYYPSGVAMSPDGTRLYVVKSDGGTTWVSVISTATHTEVGAISWVGHFARGVAVAPDGKRLYVSTYEVVNSALKVIDTASNTVITTVGGLGNPAIGVDVTPDGLFVYVATYTNTVGVISAATNTLVTTVATGSGTAPMSVRITPDGSRAYVANSSSGTLSVIDTSTNGVVGTVPNVTFSPRTLEFTPDGTRGYVATDVSVKVISTATNTVIDTIPYNSTNDGSPAAIVMSPTRIISLSGDLVFGSVLVGTTSSRTFTLANTGNALLTVSSIAFPTGFSGNWPGGTVPSGGSQDIVVTFAPTLPMTYGGNVTVSANQTGGTPTIAVSGFGFQPFTDDQLVPGSSLIRAVHIAELRGRIDAVRARHALGAYPYTDTITAGVTIIKAQHIIDLRTALSQAYVAAGLPPPSYSTSPGAGVTIVVADIADLRSAVLAIE